MKRVLPTVWAAGIALLCASVLIIAVGGAPLQVYHLLLAGTWGNAYGIGQVLFKTTPLVFTGLSGAMLVAFTEGFTDDMTAGRGYIALAALVLGGWRPLPTLAACLAFGILTALRVQYAGVTVLGVSPPSEFWAALPYLATVVALAGLLGRGRTPAGLGKP